MAGKKNGKNTKKSSEASSGKGFALLLILGLIIKLIWWILAALVLVAAFFVVRAILRENRRRKQCYAEYLAALSAAADEQNEWVMQGDDRGVYGTQGARLMDAVRSGCRWVRPEPAAARPDRASTPMEQRQCQRHNRRGRLRRTRRRVSSRASPLDPRG